MPKQMKTLFSEPRFWDREARRLEQTLDEEIRADVLRYPHQPDERLFQHAQIKYLLTPLVIRGAPRIEIEHHPAPGYVVGHPNPCYDHIAEINFRGSKGLWLAGPNPIWYSSQKAIVGSDVIILNVRFQGLDSAKVRERVEERLELLEQVASDQVDKIEEYNTRADHYIERRIAALHRHIPHWRQEAELNRRRYDWA